MRWERALACIASAAAIGSLCACSNAGQPAKPDRYIDLTFPVAKTSTAPGSHVVDASGALWYVDGDRIVRASAPSAKQSVRDADARDGRLFWYANAVYVLGGDGTHLTRVGSTLRTDPLALPAQYAPAEGVIADAHHRWLVFAEQQRHQIAVLDVWKWYAERVPNGIDPFAAALAGGPHGKKYLVVADAARPFVAIENRWNKRSVVVSVPSNACFRATGRPWRVPVDVRGRDEDRTWATAGEHAVSIDLGSKKILRTWDLDGCAMRVLTAGPDNATLLVGARDGDSYSTSVVRIDRAGVHSLGQYGTVAGLIGGAWIDRYDRLWWYDAKAHAFVCRTPLA
ncbi:MAG: hypothetical protein JOY98_01590 [Candidatus Eremiobacteraeota bacterium]|nr:hypothetical protein [Candidatus Eremiobacteraeota bacterium]MBV8284762.1 hypothetical protein [Candidatus Eremiobacteraeota bacterium]